MKPAGCPESAKLSLMLSDQIDPEMLEEIVKHLDQCQECASRLSELNDQFFAGTDLNESPKQSLPPEVNQGDGLELPERFKQTPAIDRFNRIGQFQIVCKLGEGGMGQVYQCLDTKLNRRVAVKWIKATLLSPQLLERLEREARIHARLNHPNIVALLEFGIAEGMPYLVMELVEGGTLRQLLKENRLHPQQSAVMLMEVARCIQVAHDQGVLHRDLKSANILLQFRSNQQSGFQSDDVSGNCPWIPKVTDFGLAASIDSMTELSETIETIQGTPIYMAPEQLRGSSKNVGPAADIYALGVILYELLSGRVPFSGENLAEVREMVLQQQPISPSRLQAGVPIDLETICLKCLEKEPRARYESAAALADDLDRFLHNRPILARPIGIAEQVWRWVLRNRPLAAMIFVSSLLFLLLFVGSLYFAYQQEQLRRKADELSQVAKANEKMANDRFVDLRDKYFLEMGIASASFDEFRVIVDEGAEEEKVRSFYSKLLDQRFNRANEMIHREDLRQVESESMVEAFYITALRIQETDQEKAMPLFETAVQRAKKIAAQKPLSPICRFYAINSDNYLGVMQTQRNNMDEAIRFFQDGWDNFRLKATEDIEDVRLGSFTMMIGNNLVETLKNVGRNDEAQLIWEECRDLDIQKLRKGQKPNP